MDPAADIGAARGVRVGVTVRVRVRPRPSQEGEAQQRSLGALGALGALGRGPPMAKAEAGLDVM